MIMLEALIENDVPNKRMTAQHTWDLSAHDRRFAFYRQMVSISHGTVCA